MEGHLLLFVRKTARLLEVEFLPKKAEKGKGRNKNMEPTPLHKKHPTYTSENERKSPKKGTLSNKKYIWTNHCFSVDILLFTRGVKHHESLLRCQICSCILHLGNDFQCHLLRVHFVKGRIQWLRVDDKYLRWTSLWIRSYQIYSRSKHTYVNMEIWYILVYVYIYLIHVGMLPLNITKHHQQGFFSHVVMSFIQSTERLQGLYTTSLIICTAVFGQSSSKICYFCYQKPSYFPPKRWWVEFIRKAFKGSKFNILQ